MNAKTNLRVLAITLLFTVFGIQAAAEIIQSDELEKFMTQSKIVSMKDIPVGVTLPRKATLVLDGVTRNGIFKTFEEFKNVKLTDQGQEADFRDTWKTEIAAYRLDQLIGLGLVPVTVERVSADGKHGSLQFWVESKWTEGQFIAQKIRPTDVEQYNEQMAKVRIWDNLIFNTDRNAGNLLITADYQIRLIDHSRTFHIFEQLRDPKIMTRFSKSLLDKMELLNAPMLKEKMGPYLTPDQIKALLKRRDLILKLARDMVKQKGEAAVLNP